MSTKLPLYYKSATITAVADGTHEFKPSGWLPTRGPHGGRLVIDRIYVVADASDLTLATAIISGEDRYRWIQRARVVQRDGRDRVNLRGDELRVADFLIEGAGNVLEYADISVASNQDVPSSHVIPMAKPFCFREEDYSLAVDCLDHVELTMYNEAEVEVGGGAITVNTMKYYLEAECHEEFSVELKAVDILRAHLFNSTSEFELPIGGRLQDLTLFARGATGGAAMTNFTGLRIDGLIPKERDRVTQLIPTYQRSRGIASDSGATQGSPQSTDPHVNGKAVPVLWAQGARVLDGPLAQSITLQMTNSVSSIIGIHREVVPRSADLDAHVMALYGLKESDFRVKTKGKTKRDPMAWKKGDRAYLPMTARLPGVNEAALAAR